MTYDWQKKKTVAQAIERALFAAHMHMPKGFEVVGIAVANIEAAEAAFISDIKPCNDIYVMDIMQDIAGDVTRICEECLTAYDDDEIFNAAFEKLLETVDAK